MTHPFDDLTVEALRAQGGLKWTLYGEDSLGAFVAEMDFPAAPPIVEALHEAVDAMRFGYPAPALVEQMARACAEWQARHHGWRVPAEHVHALPDVVTGFVVAVEHFSRPGSPVILPPPAYMPFVTLPEALGRPVLQVPLVRDAGRYVMDLDALDAAYRAGGDLLVLTNPHNPLGRVFTPDELHAVCAVVDRHGGRVFADEIHSPLTYPGHRHVPYASLSETAAGHTVTATSASKAWNLAGLRCAQLITSNDADARRLAEIGPFATHGAGTLGLVAATAAYTAGDAWLRDVLGYLDRNRHLLAALLAEHLPGARYDPPEGTYLAWLDLRELGLGDDPAAVIRERTGVALTSGPECGPPGRGHARLNFATSRGILEQLVVRMAGVRRGNPC